MSKDTIYRQEAIDAIERTDWYHHNRNGEMVLGANSSVHQPWYKADEILAVIENLPSAQPERKTGRWISRDGRDDCVECSECHAVLEGDEVYWRNNYFCYHCGADMRTPTQVQMDEADDVMIGGDNGKID